MKIVYCLNSIRYLGGIQRVTVVKANALSEIPGNEVYVVVTDNKRGERTEDLNSKVRLVDLDVNYYSDDWKSEINVIKGIFLKRREHKRKLKSVLQDIKPDVVISVGQSEKNFLPTIKGSWKTVREFHFVRDYRLRHANGTFGTMLAYAGDFYDSFVGLKRYDQIVVLTHEDKEANWKGWDKVKVIPNPTSFHCDEVSNLTNKVMIAIGRLGKQKNFSALIRIFRKVSDIHPDWRLEIWGTGEEQGELESLIDRLNLGNNVLLKGFTNKIDEKCLNASCFLSTSLFEGSPLALIEAMECGLPAISYACPCGPKDIIEDGVDGYLVDIGDEDGMADKICKLIECDDLRKKMGNAAKVKVSDYTISSVINQWMTLFDELLSASAE